MKKYFDRTNVFLGGTCAETNWRGEMIPQLEGAYFNPVVEDWTEDCILTEDLMKRYVCGIHLYFITSEMKGVYSIAEVVESSHQKGVETIFAVDTTGFTEGELKSLKAVGGIISANGGLTFFADGSSITAEVVSEINSRWE